MNNKSLLIKVPASIDADLPIWNALKITWNVLKSYPGGASTPQYQSGPFNANDKFEITEQKAGTTVAISKKNNFGGITISPDTEDITEFTVTVTGDDVYDIRYLGGSAGGYRIAKVDSMFGEGLNTIFNLTNLTYLDLHYTNATGDVAQLKTLTNLSYIDLSSNSLSGDVTQLKTLTSLTNLNLNNNNNITGDVAQLKTLTNLTNLGLDKTNVSGDIAELKTLTNLTYLNLSGTNVSGDIAELKTLTKCNLINVVRTNVSGDLSVLSPGVLKVSGGSSKSNQKLSWSSSTNRSSKTNIPLVITDGDGLGAWDFGNDLDNLLIDEAACTNYSGNPNAKYIDVKGNRTSASDSAIQTLQNNGWTVKIS